MTGHRLTLNPGRIFMILRNLQPANGHVNRYRYIFEFMTEDILFPRAVSVECSN